MKNFSIIILFFSASFLSSCQKKDIEGVDKNKLKITISKPLEAQVFNAGDTVYISASADYVSQLHGYSIQITDKASNELYLDIDKHLHDSSFGIDTFWVNKLQQNADLTLKITVEIDHNGNQETKEINFKTKN